jgi:UPF0042 nucleotide-binding protein
VIDHNDHVSTDSAPAPTEGRTVPSRPEMVVLTGLSGAGRSTAANALEDQGWFVVDNLPPALLPSLLEVSDRGSNGPSRLAAVVDARGGEFFSDLTAALGQLEDAGIHPRVLFLDADDDELVRRFEGSRRPHPLQGNGRVVDGIAAERVLLADLRDRADLLVDTSDLNVHQLRARIDQAFSGESRSDLRVTVMSFGFKYGLPPDADLVVDCRFLPNPHWVPALRQHTGLDADVAHYVLDQPLAVEFLAAYEPSLTAVLRGYGDEGKRFALLAVGCTGGKHRSVAMTQEIARRLGQHGVDVRVEHRDLGRE